MKIGEVINGYEILEHINSGGMGSVYKVIKDNKIYALKTCFTTDVELIKRFEREIRLMESIKHDNVISIIDKMTHNGIPCFIMPLCEKSLDKAVKDGLSDNEKFDYVIQFCLGVKALHDAGEIHRDIKPNNALLLNKQIKVSDLGLGKFINRDSSILTPTFAPMGTMEYMSPEVYSAGKGRDADKRSDIYSIGNLIYFVYSNGNSPFRLDASLVEGDIFPIIEKCTKVSPVDRYQDVSEIISDLKTCQEPRNTPLSIKDAISKHRIGVNNAEFSDMIYRYLLSRQYTSLEGLVVDLKQIGAERFEILLANKKTDIDNIINIFLSTYNNTPHYWLQFSDVEVVVGRARSLLKSTNSLSYKQALLELSVNISKEYNRFAAMEIVGRMLADLSETEMRSLSVFFKNNKEAINDMKDSFRTPIPDIIEAYL